MEASTGVSVRDATRASVAVSPPAIPYRVTSPVSSERIVSAMGITVLMLVALVLAVLHARRRGWLIHTGARAASAESSPIITKSSRRISAASTLYLVTCQGKDYLMVESVKGVHATLVPASAATSGENAS